MIRKEDESLGSSKNANFLAEDFAGQDPLEKFFGCHQIKLSGQ